MYAQEGTSIADSPYARQLRVGFKGLRFSQPLEQEFREEHGTQHLLRMRLGFIVAIVFYALFLAIRLDSEPGEAASWGLLLRLCIIAGLSVSLAASFQPVLRRHLPKFLFFSYLVFGSGVTMIEVVAHQYGIDRHYEGLILVSIHCYVFSGLLLRGALASGLAVTLSYVVGGTVGGLLGTEWAYQVLFIVLTNLIAAAALYSTEYVERENFLRRHLLREMAARDGLTGVHNRHAFMLHLERVVRQARREGRVLALMMLDIDWFKPYNDHYGHVEGDACLQRVAEAIHAEFKRGLDMSARYGGEEFIGVWYDIDPRALAATVEAVRARIEKLAIPHAAAPLGIVTVSAGAIAFVPQAEDSLPELIREADAQLYAAKGEGRNRVMVEVLPTAQPAPVALRA